VRAYCAFSSYEGCSQINDNISKNKVLSLMVLMFYLNVIPLLFMDTITFQAKLTKISCSERRHKQIRKRGVLTLNSVQCGESVHCTVHSAFHLEWLFWGKNIVPDICTPNYAFSFSS
jgi:hypothetical protein